MKVTQGASPNQLPAEPTTPPVAGAEGPVPVQGAVEVPVTTPDAGVGVSPPEPVAGQAVTSAEISTDAAAAGQVLSGINASPDAPQAGVPPAAESPIGGQAAEPVHPTVAATEAMKTEDLGALEGVVEGKPVVASQENEQDLAGIVTADTTGSAATAETVAPPVIEAPPGTAPVAAPAPAPEPIVAADPTVPPDAAPVVDAAAKPASDAQILNDNFPPSVPVAETTPVPANQTPLAPAVPEPVAPAVAAEPVGQGVEPTATPEAKGPVENLSDEELLREIADGQIALSTWAERQAQRGGEQNITDVAA